MKKSAVLTLLILCAVVAYGQNENFYQFNNQFNVTRSSRTAFTSMIIFTPCPQSNAYQDIYELYYSTAGDLIHNEIEENNNQYFELVLNDVALKAYQQNFSVLCG